MAASLVQAFVDKENTLSTTSKGRLGSTNSTRQISGKTFGGNSFETPRKALGNINNDPGMRTALGNVNKTGKKDQGSVLKKLPKTPAPNKAGRRMPSVSTPSFMGRRMPSISTPSFQAQSARKQSVKVAHKVEVKEPVEDLYPDIEYMPDCKQKDDYEIDVWDGEGLPWVFTKDCRLLPSRDLFTKPRTISEPDFSLLEIELPPPREDLFSPLFNMDDFASGIIDVQPIVLPDFDDIF